jgi:class 3 adenylate cyclase/predicted ATPase
VSPRQDHTGTPLRPLPETPATSQASPEAERRQLTVIFCDLEDSTALAGQLEIEDYRDVIRAYQEACAEVIRRYDGYIAQYLGDGVLIYFGYPLAHEDDAQRAVHAGLEIGETLAALNARLRQEKRVTLAVRLGIHTGLVIVGKAGGEERHEPLAFGDTLHIAARIQGIAAPNTIVISAATARLVQGYFVCEDLGAHPLRGIAAPIRLSRVLQASGAHSRLDTVSTAGLTPLVGRDTEVTLLLERWTQASEGSGQVIALRGEPGMGKSRLVQALKDHIPEASYLRLECRCSPYYQHSALYPVVDLVQRALRWSPDDAPDDKVRKLETALAQLSLSGEETLALFTDLLPLPHQSTSQFLRHLTPQQQRHKTLQAILTVVLELAARQPVLLIVDDLHWTDPSTLELLTLIVEQVPTTRICVVLTCRPTFRLPWEPHSYLTQITLSRLQQRQVEQMVLHITGGKLLPAEVLQALVAKTDGVPLFVEELTKSLLETDFLWEAEDQYQLLAPLPTLAIPATLHDSLMARLDRLGTAKSVAQLGATLGRQFTYEILHAASLWDEAVLHRELERLIDAELLYQHGLPPQTTYVFKHALIQATAYQSLLRSTKQDYHQRIAQVLLAQFPAMVEAQPELLAHHYTEGGLIAQAIDYWQRAGQRAVERSANVEAISHFTKGLELLKTLPDTPEHAQQELVLQLAVGTPLLIIKGHTAPEAEYAYRRAQELCQGMGESPQRFAALRGLWRFYLNQAKLQTARELAEQCFRLAQRLQEPVLLQEAHLLLGATLFYLGELVSARAHLEQGIALYDPQSSRTRAFNQVTDPGVVCLAWVAWTLWLLGYPDRALLRNEEALALAQELAHAYSLGFAWYFASALHSWRREGPLIQEKLDMILELCSKQGFKRWLGGSMIKQGWMLAEQGLAEEGLEQMRQGLNTWRAAAGELGLPGHLAKLAEAYGRGGRVADGLRVLDEALTAVVKNTEHYYEAELYRIKGELLLQQRVPDEQQAEACFQRALEVARGQQAKSWELRAATSLSRLWQQQGKWDEARQLLAEIYGWFSEGFTTPDLQDAQTLLAALA